jgi:hypothetical protein
MRNKTGISLIFAASALVVGACGDAGDTSSPAEGTPEPSASMSVPSTSPSADVGEATGTPGASASADLMPSADPSSGVDASASPDGGLDGWPSPEDQEFAFFRDSDDGTLVGGVVLARLSNGTGVTVGLDPAVAGSQPLSAHLHAGGCDAAQAQVVQELGTWSDGALSTQLTMPLDDVLGQGYSIGLHADASADVHVACAELDGVSQ